MEGKLPSLLTSKAIKTWDTPDSSFFLLISLVERPPDKIAAKMSSSKVSPDPFQNPIGNGRFELRISDGSRVSSLDELYPPGKSSIEWSNAFVSILPYEYWLIAISRTIASSPSGTAIT